jgi:CRISPR-associated endonuclease C2c1-like protein
MNRIYQGRVTRVEIPKRKSGEENSGELQWLRFHTNPELAEKITNRIEELRPDAEAELKRRNETKGEKLAKGLLLLDYERLQDESRTAWEQALWQHHELFQDAVNYYLVAIAALGHSPESPLTRLRERVAAVWDDATKKGEERQGIGTSFQRIGARRKMPKFVTVVRWFQHPLRLHGVEPLHFELAGESLLQDLGGKGSVQQVAIEYWPYFCQAAFKRGVQFPRSRAQLLREKAAQQLPRLLHRSNASERIERILRALRFEMFANPVSGVQSLSVEASAAVIADAVDYFPTVDWIPKEWRKQGDEPARRRLKEIAGRGIELPAYAGGSINKEGLKERFYAYLLFAHVAPDARGFELLRSCYQKPKEKKTAKKDTASEKRAIERRLRSLGDDPIEAVRAKSRIVFRAFTALPFWRNESEEPLHLYDRSLFGSEIDRNPPRVIAWKEFDVAAFEEALKVLNQFSQNLKNRAEKIARLKGRMDWMDGVPGADTSFLEEKEAEPPVFKTKRAEDQRIVRLREIVNTELAEEYRLTEGLKTSYGLRRRTMKGWSDVKRKWQSIVKVGDTFTPEKQEKLKKALDKLRGKKREQIGSHKLFEALIADDASWAIWREPTENEAKIVADNNFASDPLDVFRRYSETRETLDELRGRELNFTPADARRSRRLFMFSDACPFGGREYFHDPKQLAVVVPVAIRGDDGCYRVSRVRLSYSAPRLLRDQLRTESGTLSRSWVQPMMAALFDGGAKPAQQDISVAAVQLMPDEDAKGERRFLLNFPLDLSPVDLWRRIYELRERSDLFRERYSKRDKKKEKPLHGGLWEASLRTFWEGDKPKKRDVLLWPSDEPKTHEWCPKPWWEAVSNFNVLAADLGTRHAASVALVNAASAKPDGKARFIGEACGKRWFAQFRAGKILRLPGEDATVLRHRTRQDEANDHDDEAKRCEKDFREELHGSAGRLADEFECEQTIAILASLDHLELLPEDCRETSAAATLRERLTFPEQNDKVLVGIRRAQGWVADLISMHWRLVNPEKPEQRDKALAEIKEEERKLDWRTMADDPAQHANLSAAMHEEIARLRQTVQQHLLLLTHRILPLRDRVWIWAQYAGGERFKDCHVLQQAEIALVLDKQGEKSEFTPKLRGQRGLSMARIEQLGELRRRWQSLNQSLRREIGNRPLTVAEMRGAPIPDPCPDVLRKLEEIREQRVNQIAHMILAEALGLRLKAPASADLQRREDADIHGEYERIPDKNSPNGFRAPVDFIVLEDLARYLSSQGRAKSENSRLMEWSHRQITAKVKELAEPFGIPVLETGASWSSRFCSISGIAGFRGIEVSPANASDYKWRKLREEYDEAQLERAAAPASKETKISVEARGAHHLFEQLAKVNNGREGKHVLTLLAPQPGGPIFVGAKELAGVPASQQADINAAISLALRAIAHAACADIHSRLPSERQPAKKKDQADKFYARAERRFGKAKKVEIVPVGKGTLPKEPKPNFFYDPHQVAREPRARLVGAESQSGTTGENGNYAPYGSLWGKVNAPAFQWWRCRQLNNRRLTTWKRTGTLNLSPGT